MELSFNANNGKFVFYEDGNGVRVGWMKASKFPWCAALFSGSALRCGLMDMASVLGTEGRRFEPHDGCIIVLGYGTRTTTTVVVRVRVPRPGGSAAETLTTQRL